MSGKNAKGFALREANSCRPFLLPNTQSLTPKHATAYFQTRGVLPRNTRPLTPKHAAHNPRIRNRLRRNTREGECAHLVVRPTVHAGEP